MNENADSLSREVRQWPSPGEARIWAALRGHRLDGASFRRRRPIGRYIADFVCDAAKLIVVVAPEGSSPDRQSAEALEHEGQLLHRGYQILHVSAEEILNDLGSVLGRIRVALASAETPSPPPGAIS